MSSTRTYRQLLDQIRPLLPDYLAGHGVEIGGNGRFRCINPEHDDKDPSCGFVTNERTTFHCFACLASGDIFHAAHLMEGKPLVGRAFIEETVIPLAERFSIPVPEFEVTDKQLQQSETFRAYQLAGRILAGSKEEGPLQKAYSGTLEEWRTVDPHIGTVPWDVFTEKMRELGDYGVTYLDQIGITSKLFDDFRLTFGIKTPSGHLCGFVSRDTRDNLGKNQSKWYNTPGTVPIFEKSTLLYGINDARTEAGPIYLVEGYADAIALRLAGIRKVVAYMGANLTAGQVNLLLQKRCTDVILVPDWDENDAGAKGMENAIEHHFTGVEDFNVRVKQLPRKEGVKSYDPFDFMQEHKAEDFLRLPEQSAFDWVLGRLPDDLTSEQKCERMFDLIVAEPNGLKQEAMIKELSAQTDVRLQALRRELDRRLEERRAETKRKLRRKVDQTRTLLEQEDPTTLPDKLRQAALEMEEIQGLSYTDLIGDPNETREFVHALRQEFWDLGTELRGWITGFPTIDDTLGGIPKKECVLAVAADGNVGKSAIVQNIALQVAMRNDDVSVLFFTIDDTRSQTIPRLVAQMSGVKIGWIEQPQRYSFNAEQDQKMQEAWSTIDKLIQEERLDIRDASQGNSLSYAEAWIDKVRDENPRKKILFVLDNFHLLSGPKEERERIESNCRHMSLLAKQRAITILCTMELSKRKEPQKRPRMGDLKGSKKLEYESNVVMMVHSELHAKPDDAGAQSWIDEADPDGMIKKPVLQLWIDKNKVTSFKGLREMRFKPDTCQLFSAEGGMSLDDDEGSLDEL